jgi:hypothetical protein
MSEGTTAAAIATSNVLGGRSVCPNQEILELYDTLCVFVAAEQRGTI